MKKKLLAALVLGYCGSAFAAYPAGLWHIGQTRALNTGGSPAEVTLWVQLNGDFRGIIWFRPPPDGDLDCDFIVFGSFVHGGTWVTLGNHTNDEVAAHCEQRNGYGGALGVQNGNSLKFTLSTTLLKGTVTLSQTTAAYDTPSSLKLIAGHYPSSDSLMVETVTSTGAFTSYNADTKCSGSGHYTVVDPKHNVYSYVETLTGCDEFDGFLNGLTMTGIATVLTYTDSGVHYKYIDKFSGSWGKAALAEDTRGFYSIGH